MKKFRVGFDIDDVLISWYVRAHEACKLAGITNGVEPTTWRPHDEYEIPVEDWLAVLETVTLDGSLYLNHGPDEDAVRALRSLIFDGHEVHLITARGSGSFSGHDRLIKRHTIRWLERYAVPYKTLSFTRQKGARAKELRLDWFLDDNEDNFRDVSQALDYDSNVRIMGSQSRSILLTRPWNQGVATFPDQRVSSVQQYVDIIKEAANRE